MLEILISIVFLIFSLPISSDVQILIQEIQYKPIVSLMLGITTPGIIVMAFLLVLFLIQKKKYKILFLAILTSPLTFLICNIIKNMIHIQRPENIFANTPLALATGYSFPSQHTAFMFCLIPLLKPSLERKHLYIWYFFSLLIAFSRIYLGVHRLMDIAGGILIGYIVGYSVYQIERKYKILEKFFRHIKNKFELRRQLFHAFFGLSIVFLYNHNLISPSLLLLALILGGILSFLSLKYKLFIVSILLKYFERDFPRKHFPGKGVFFLLLGSFLSMLIFPKNIALASISIMAVGDSVCNIVGSYFGKIKNPLNPKKNIEGYFASLILSTLAANYFVPFYPALFASVIAMFIESLDFKISKWTIDDNLSIPLIAGGILMIFIK